MDNLLPLLLCFVCTLRLSLTRVAGSVYNISIPLPLQLLQSLTPTNGAAPSSHVVLVTCVENLYMGPTVHTPLCLMFTSCCQSCVNLLVIGIIRSGITSKRCRTPGFIGKLVLSSGHAVFGFARLMTQISVSLPHKVT